MIHEVTETPDLKLRSASTCTVNFRYFVPRTPFAVVMPTASMSKFMHHSWSADREPALPECLHNSWPLVLTANMSNTKHDTGLLCRQHNMPDIVDIPAGCADSEYLAGSTPNRSEIHHSGQMLTRTTTK